jgi:dephospho-CoA kinase
MKVIGVVGGIASGKSIVATQFRRLGAATLDADQIGHAILRQGPVMRAIRDLWGDEVFDEHGEVDRRAVASLVFGPDEASRERLAWLEQLTHPLIGEQLRSEIERLKWEGTVPAVVLDAPVLMKAGWHLFCDYLVFVDAGDEIRKQRALARGWTEQEWRWREATQTPLDQAKRLADAVIENSAAVEQTRRRVGELWDLWGLPVGNPAAGTD